MSVIRYPCTEVAMIQKSCLFGCALSAALLLSPGLSRAAIVVYQTQPEFTAAVSAPGVDTYLGFSLTQPTSSPIVRFAGPYGYSGSASTSSFFGGGTTVNPWLSTNVAADMITFTPSSASVSAIGGNFFGSDVNGAFAAGDISLVATDAGSSVTRTIVGATTSSFRGFVSDDPPISLIVASVPPASGFLWPTVDNLTLALALVTDRIFQSGFD
jgi:hypothetical protein